MYYNKDMKQKSSGFTIVELLIVIAVIVILASITAVVYTGSITDSKNNGSKANAYIIQKKLEAYMAGTGSYPFDTTTNTTVALITANLNSRADSSLANSGLYLTGSWDTSSNPDQTKVPGTAVLMSYCVAPTPNPAQAGAYRLQYYDFKNSAAATTTVNGSLGTVACASWQPITN